MHKIKIKEAGWDGYSGILGSLVFENGVSTTVPTKVQADQFGVVMKFVEVDDEGNEIGLLSANQELIRVHKIGMEVVVPLKSVAEKEAERAAAVAVAAAVMAPPTIPAPDPMPIEAPAEADKVWTEAELEAIADKEGIKGLRKIGTPLGAKNTSIAALIAEIIEAQKKVK